MCYTLSCSVTWLSISVGSPLHSTIQPGAAVDWFSTFSLGCRVGVIANRVYQRVRSNESEVQRFMDAINKSVVYLVTKERKHNFLTGDSVTSVRIRYAYNWQSKLECCCCLLESRCIDRTLAGWVMAVWSSAFKLSIAHRRSSELMELLIEETQHNSYAGVEVRGARAGSAVQITGGEFCSADGGRVGVNSRNRGDNGDRVAKREVIK